MRSIKQDHDRKIMDADFPLQLMAAGKVVIDFGDSSYIDLPGAEDYPRSGRTVPSLQTPDNYAGVKPGRATSQSTPRVRKVWLALRKARNFSWENFPCKRRMNLLSYSSAAWTIPGSGSVAKDLDYHHGTGQEYGNGV